MKTERRRCTLKNRESKTQRVVSLEGLGLCENEDCDALLTIDDMPVEAMDVPWECPRCKKSVTGKTFGYEQVGGKWQRVRWVGPGRKWVAVRPVEDFDLGGWNVRVRRPDNICRVS